MNTSNLISKKELSQTAIIIIFFLYGLTLTTLQIIYLRFFLSLFYGNELSIGLFFFSWLFWTALGSYFLGKVKQPLNYLANHHFLFGLLIPFTYLLMLFVKVHFLPAGSILPDLKLTVFTVFSSLSLFGIFSGGFFPLYSKLFRQATQKEIATAGSWVYFGETFGSLFGGIITGLILINLFDGQQIVLGLAILQFTLSFFFIAYNNIKKKNLIIFIYFLIGLMSFTSFLSSFQHRYQQLWQGLTIVDHANSAYGNLVLTQLDHSFTLYQDGVPLFTVPDPETAEETVHYALLLHKNPQTILLIGGGFSGALFEVLKHPSIQKLHYVELDPKVIDLYQKHFKENWQILTNDPRIQIHKTDGRSFLNHTKQKFDVIIVALPDPYNSQLNRFYSREFFSLCKYHLYSNGILSFQLSASENYLNSAQRKYLKAIKNSFDPIFKNWSFLPGRKVQFFLVNSKHPLNITTSLLIKRLKKRKIETLYVRDYYIPFKLLPDRIELFKSAFQKTSFDFFNSDFRPLAYYFDIVLWAGKTSTRLAHFFSQLIFFPFKNIIILFYLFFFLFLLILSKQKYSKILKINAFGGMFTIGFTGISMELIILLTFQVAFGYIYQQIALFIALFMGGMGLGSYIGIFFQKKYDALLTKFGVILLFAWSFFSIFLYKILTINTIIFTSTTYFYVIAIISGFLGGIGFPVFNKIFLTLNSADDRKSGIIYAWDLIGSLTGSITCSLIFIPIYGLKMTILFLGILNLTVGSSSLIFLLKNRSY